MAGSSAELAILIKAHDEASQKLQQIADNTEHIGIKAGIAAEAAHVAFGLIEAAAGAVAGAFAYTIGTAADFEAEMSAIKAVTGASAEDMEALSAVALQLGKDTAFSAKESAEGIEELVKGGVSVADIYGGAAAAALNLAAAGGASVADSAALAANAMSLFNLKGEETAHVADMIAGFANATTGDMTDFKFALQQAGAAATLAGQDFDNTAVAIALMAQQGHLGSDAGTSLKTMLLNLVPSTNSAIDAFKELGIFQVDTNAAMQAMTDIIMSKGEPGMKKLADAAKDGSVSTQELFSAVKSLAPEVLKGAGNFDELAMKLGYTSNAFLDAEGNYKDLRDISEVLRLSTEGMSESQQTLAFKMAFGNDAIKAASDLAKGGAEAFDAMTESMEGISAADVAATRLDNLAGKTQALQGSVETAAIIFGTAFLPVLSQLVDEATTFLNEAVIPWAEEHGPEMAAQAAAVAAGFMDLLHAVGDIVSAFSGFGDVISSNSTQLSIVGGLVASGATAWAIYEAGVVAARAATLAQIIATDALAVSQAALNVLMTMNPIGLVVVALAGLAAALVIAYNTNEDFRNAVDTAWAAIQAAAEVVFPAIGEAIHAVIEVLGEIISAASDLPGEVGGFFDEMGTIVNDALESIHDNITDIWNQIPLDIRADLELIANNLLERWNGFVTMIAGGNAQIMADVTATWNGITTAIGTKLDEIGAAVGGAFSSLGTTVHDAFESVKTNILTPLGDALTGVVTWAGDLLGKIGSLRDELILKALDIGKGIVDGILDGLGNGAQLIKDKLGDIARGALQSAKDALAIQSPSGAFRDQVGIPIVEGIIAGIDDSDDGLYTAIAGLAGGTVTAFVGELEDPEDGLQAQVEDVLDTLASYMLGFHLELPPIEPPDVTPIITLPTNTPTTTGCPPGTHPTVFGACEPDGATLPTNPTSPTNPTNPTNSTTQLPPCPPGYARNSAGNCESTTTSNLNGLGPGQNCPTGTVWNGNQCVAIPSTSGTQANCLPGQYRDASGNCTGEPLNPTYSGSGGTGNLLPGGTWEQNPVTGQMYYANFAGNWVPDGAGGAMWSSTPMAGSWYPDGPFEPVTWHPLALGGIVMSPTRALIGEAGPEAVIPLRGNAGGGSAVIDEDSLSKKIAAAVAEALARTPIIATLSQYEFAGAQTDLGRRGFSGFPRG